MFVFRSRGRSASSDAVFSIAAVSSTYSRGLDGLHIVSYRGAQILQWGCRAQGVCWRLEESANMQSKEG